MGGEHQAWASRWSRALEIPRSAIRAILRRRAKLQIQQKSPDKKFLALIIETQETELWNCQNTDSQADT